MPTKTGLVQRIHIPFQTIFIIFLITIVIVILQSIYAATHTAKTSISTDDEIESLLSMQIRQNHYAIQSDNVTHRGKTFETTIQCRGPLHNQTCLFENLYYFNSKFIIFTVKGRQLPDCRVHTNAFNLLMFAPQKRVFKTYEHLEKFVLALSDMHIIPSTTVYFGQYWMHNIGHALFDGLYPAFVALMRFAPRHLQPFRILASIAPCDLCWSEDVYSRFAGLGLIKQYILNHVSKSKWFMFDEVVIGSGKFCQRCVQPHLQLPGGVELDASRLFRNRMYRQMGLIPPLPRYKSSSERRTPRDILQAYVIHNKRFTNIEQKEIHKAIREINTYTNDYLSKTSDETLADPEWPLINVTYFYYGSASAQTINGKMLKQTPTDSRSPVYELAHTKFASQLRTVRQMDIHVTGPGTGQMYQTFLSDGSVTVNLGGLRSKTLKNVSGFYTSFLEQHVTSGTPYIKGLYYPINKRLRGIKKDEVLRLIRRAGQMILNGFTLPVNPWGNLAPDGQLFVEMCTRDQKFCSSVTNRTADNEDACFDFWPEDFVHEQKQWKREGSNVSCAFNRLLLQQLREKYQIEL
ncbi:unnamed protein product [Adineta ricciae]|uniref:Uncharacterized protein n=1 Tax=Adineta ricciae TaxID=249248 RepID=A0A813Q639_ADIRI|nr:unnamed protein product [Adineta ricciae]